MDKIGMGVLGGLALLGIGTFMASRKKIEAPQVIEQPQPVKQVWALGSNLDRESLVDVPIGGKRKRKRKYTKKL